MVRVAGTRPRGKGWGGLGGGCLDGQGRAGVGWSGVGHRRREKGGWINTTQSACNGPEQTTGTSAVILIYVFFFFLTD